MASRRFSVPAKAFSRKSPKSKNTRTNAAGFGFLLDFMRRFCESLADKVFGTRNNYMNLTESAQFRVLLFILVASFMPLTAPAKVTFTDPLARQTDKWTPSTAGTGPSITFAGGRMLQSYPANATPDPANNISAVYTPNFLLVGDFDARVDYAIDHYDPVPGFPVSGLRVQLAFNMTSAERVGWENLGYDVYVANHYWNIVTVPTSDLSGTLRIVRQGGQVSSYFKSGNGWQLIQTSSLQTQDLGPVRVTLGSGFPGYAFPGVAMKAAFSNYRVTAEKIDWLHHEPHHSSQEAPAASHMKKGIPGAQTVPAPVAVENSEATSMVATVKFATPAIVSAPQGLEIKLAPALSLTGDVGSNYRIEFTSALGATNEWSSLAVITLTNNPQIYFDASAIGQPSRFYRVQKVP